jgi:copper chaperone NosL
MTSTVILGWPLFMIGLWLGACTQPTKPQMIVYGKDSCAYCHMTFSDARFGAQLITKKGKTVLFDSVNCLHGYLKQIPSSDGQIYFADSFHKDHWIEAKNTHFTVTPGIRSPMGAGVFSAADLKELKSRFPNEGTMTWNELSDQLNLGKYK